MNIFFGLFLIAHGLVHGLYFLPKPRDDPKYPFYFNKSWFSKKARKNSETVGKVLTVFVICTFLISGIMIMGFSSYNYLWLTTAVIAAITSNFLFILFWHKWLTLGFIINLIIIFTSLKII